MCCCVDGGLPLTTPEDRGTTTSDINNYETAPQPVSTYEVSNITYTTYYDSEIIPRPEIAAIVCAVLGCLLVIIVGVSVAVAILLFVFKRGKQPEKVEKKNSCESRFLHDSK